MQSYNVWRYFVVKIEFMFAVIVSHLSVISRHEDLLCWNDWSDIKNRSVKSSAFREVSWSHNTWGGNQSSVLYIRLVARRQRMINSWYLNDICCVIKWEKTATVGTDPKSNKDKMYTTNTRIHIHDHSMIWLNIGTLISSGRVKLLWGHSGRH